MSSSRRQPRRPARRPAPDAAARSAAERSAAGRIHDAIEIADRLHSAAIHLLRRVRTEDAAAGLTGPQLSALSVIVFRGPITVGDLAGAEQVRPPTISRLVRELERRRLIERVAQGEDARQQHVQATEAGKRLLSEGRARRVAHIAADIRALTKEQLRTLWNAAELLETLGGARR